MQQGCWGKSHLWVHWPALLRLNHQKVSCWASLLPWQRKKETLVTHASLFQKGRICGVRTVRIALHRLGSGPALKALSRSEPCRFLSCMSAKKRQQRTEPKSMIWKKYEKLTLLPPPHAELEGWLDIELSQCFSNRNNTADWFKRSALRVRQPSP